MYGLVNTAVQGLITREHGEEVWNKIVAQAGQPDEPFIAMGSYEDDVTYSLVKAASEVLETDAGDLLEAFGEYWTLYVVDQGYGHMLDTSPDFETLLENLDDMHGRISLSLPKLKPPSFQCERLTDQSIRLHYYSDRPGLSRMVVGLLKGLGKRFELDVKVEMASTPGGDHEEFLVNW